MYTYFLHCIVKTERIFGKMAEGDNNLQGQGFVLRVQRTAHIEKWTKCYSKNLSPPPSINIRMYVFIYL